MTCRCESAAEGGNFDRPKVHFYINFGRTKRIIEAGILYFILGAKLLLICPNVSAPPPQNYNLERRYCFALAES